MKKLFFALILFSACHPKFYGNELRQSGTVYDADIILKMRKNPVLLIDGKKYKGLFAVQFHETNGITITIP